MTRKEIQKLTGLSLKEIKEKIAAVEAQLIKIDPKTSCFSHSIFLTVQTHKGVLIKVPVEQKNRDLPGLKNVVEHVFNTFYSPRLNSVKEHTIPSHFNIGDFPYYTKEGKMRPRVARHFFAHKDALGKKIVADVIVKRKIDLVTGIELVVIDIIQTPGVTPKMKMSLEAEPQGKENETIIPETGKCIRFENLATKEGASTGN